MNDWLFQGDFTPQPTDYRIVLLALLLAFLGGHLIAWLYSFTHNGLSYSRSFVKSLVVLPVLVAFVLMVMSNSLVTAFGLMAVLAIVRFRNVLRDTLDTTYLLGAIVIGLACGTQRFSTALLGCGMITLIFVYLWFTGFGSRHSYDLILNVNWTRPVAELQVLADMLDRHSLRIVPTSQHRAASGGTELSYRLLLRDPGRVSDMVTELRELEGVSRVNTITAENESES